MHAERKSYKCQREKIQKQQNTEMAGVTLNKFLRKRKNFLAIVSASLFYTVNVDFIRFKFVVLAKY